MEGRGSSLGSSKNPIGAPFGRKTVWDRGPAEDGGEGEGGGSSGSSYGMPRGDEREREHYGGPPVRAPAAYAGYGREAAYAREPPRGEYGKGGYGGNAYGDYHEDFAGKGGMREMAWNEYEGDQYSRPFNDPYGMRRGEYDEHGGDWDRRGPGAARPGAFDDRSRPDMRGSAVARGRPLGAGAGAAGRDRGSSTMTLLVTALSHRATEDDLGKVFEEAGLEVESVHISVDRETGQSRGQAFVDVRIGASEDPEVASDFAIRRLTGTEICGRAINVELRGQEPSGYAKGGYGMTAPTNRGGMTSVFGNLGKGAPGMAGKGPLRPGEGYGDRAVPPIRPAPSNKTKIVICQYWRENRCNRGEGCSYAHGEHELRSPQAAVGAMGGAGMKGAGGGGPAAPPPMIRSPSALYEALRARAAPPAPAMARGGPPGGVMPPPPVPNNRKTQLCVYFKEGRCTRGNQCHYAHGEHELINDGSRGMSPVRDRRAAMPARGERPAAPRVGRFEGVRGRAGSRSRSLRGRAKKINFAKPTPLEAVNRSECAVQGPAPPRQRGIVQGGTPLSGSDSRAGTTEKTVDAEGRETVDVEKDEKAESKTSATPITVAPFLLNQEGASQLEEMYGLGAKLLLSMGWTPGKGTGANQDGELEPVSIHTMMQPTTHYGRKDRRCLGRRRPRRFLDSEESSPSRTPSASSSVSRRSKSGPARKTGAAKRAAKQSSKSSESEASRKKRRRRRKRKKSKSSSSSSRKSSSSSSSSSSRSRKKKKKKGKFTSDATEAAAQAGASAAPNVAQPPTPAPAAAPAEDPDTAMAKKRVLAKLTELQKIEPKEERAKQFRALLRDWHPDKNPEKKDMATAVFQFLQKGKSLLNLK
eukprot:TRINITY_DN41774_c0_g1_i1.p1 TRINITY_DN41774_c0_g1~~TRINITY_DN41774_c0_g1_i1.p1  ORF type:complete len:867 (-),score=126.05 TRINITY_DN41774_c0_g1_i1:65-2665(-)